MRSGFWLAAVLVLASCGDEPSTPAGAPSEGADPASANQAPEVAGAELTPAEAIVGEELRVESSVSDPEGDRVDVRIQWFVNRELQDATGETFDTETLKRGDEIYAVVRASDGQLEGVGQTPHVLLGNSPPRITALTVRPERPDASQTVVAEVSAQDRDADAYEVHFEWILNGKPIAGATGATLEPGQVKRGDKLQIRARASDADPGSPFESAPIVIANARPQITSEPNTALAGEDRYQYQLTAKDPDGDRPLRYSLVSGPDGMEVDIVSGLVAWTVPSDADGKFEIEVAVRDTQGAEARQTYALEFHWEEVPAKKSKPAKPATNDDY